METNNSKDIVAKSARSFYILYTGQLFSLLGSSISSFVIVWWLTITTGSALYLALGTLFVLVPSIIMMPFTGVLIDRWNRKWVMGVADFLQALVTLFLIFAFFTGFVEIYFILFMILLKGITQAFHTPAFQSVIPILVPRKKLAKNNSLIALADASVQLIGPIIAAASLMIAPIHIILWVDLLTFLIAVIPLFIIKIPDVRIKKAVKDSKFKEEFMEGLRFIKSKKGFIPLLISFTWVNMTITPMGVLLPLFIVSYHGGSAVDFALISVMFQIGIIGSSLIFASIIKISNLMRAIIIGLSGIYLGMLIMAITPYGQLWLIFFSLILIGIFVTLAGIGAQTIWQKTVPLNMQGRVAGVRITISTASAPIGIILGGLLAESFGAAEIFLGFGLIGIIILILLIAFTSMRQADSEENLIILEVPVSQTDEGTAIGD